MADFDDILPVGAVAADGGDRVAVGRQGAVVHLELAGAGREPFEVWLAPSDAERLAELLRAAAQA
ncbi:MAG: hypothetical protein IPM45_02640 [Acidimicrobiales bacterium]|nr:hypothetical protein [Acidimicrobiales bacterium]